jgi:hypothetical protein
MSQWTLIVGAVIANGIPTSISNTALGQYSKWGFIFQLVGRRGGTIQDRVLIKTGTILVRVRYVTHCHSTQPHM